MSSLGKDGGVGGPSFDTEECQRSYKPINILSPNPEALSKISVGVKLEIQPDKDGLGKSLFILYQGETVGSITRFVPQIIKCLEKGHNYIAIVTSLEGASCVIEARMES